MRDNWDLPADCDAGELFAYAQILFDRIRGARALGRSGQGIGLTGSSTAASGFAII
jgi:hypothetical protein